NLSARALYLHCPLFHINAKVDNNNKTCPVCSKRIHGSDNVQRHIHDKHYTQIEDHIEYNSTQVYAFSLVVVRRNSDSRYLLVQEFAESGYWLPGGKIDPGESLITAAIRETKEEGGIDIRLTGILKIEYI